MFYLLLILGLNEITVSLLVTELCSDLKALLVVFMSAIINMTHLFLTQASWTHEHKNKTLLHLHYISVHELFIAEAEFMLQALKPTDRSM